MCVCVESFTKLRHRDDVLEETDHRITCPCVGVGIIISDCDFTVTFSRVNVM